MLRSEIFLLAGHLPLKRLTLPEARTFGARGAPRPTSLAGVVVFRSGIGITCAHQIAMPEPASAMPGFLARTMVVIPALNEEGCVGDTVRRWLALGVSGVRVVDNGSADGTASAARVAGAEVLTEARRGYGAAAWRGLQDWPAGFEWVLFSSADGSDRLSPGEASAWRTAAEDGADLVIGDRVSLPASRAELK